MLGIYWGNHHHLVYTITEVNSSILWANLLLLFCLSFVPFATGWMGENHFAPLTVAGYSLLCLVCDVSYYILLLVIRNSNRHNEALLNVLRKQSTKGALTCMVYVICIPAAFIPVAITGG
jgi:uncharacterized membrane protein